ncbi:transient receptor potential cation channel subfamily V member 1-like isoform 2-T2 [Aulostomus maculatus]
MEEHQLPDTEEASKDQNEEENSLNWLLGEDSSEIILAPMDTNVSLAGESSAPRRSFVSEAFNRGKIFEAASQGDTTHLSGLLEYLQVHKKRLTSPEFTDETNGKTALLKALLHLKDGKNDTIEVFLNIAEKIGDLEDLINASYKDSFYKGQSALHIAIERRSFDHVKLLVRKGADVQAKANGKFFQRRTGLGFYFGELPLSLAACTNQPDIVSFLMDNPHRKADVTDKDSHGNTVLHTLVVIADNTEENTEMILRMYDEILIQHNRLEGKENVHLEAIENNHGLTPLKLAAKLGRIGLLRHILQREFLDEERRPMSRKFSDWVYGPVQSSLYDISSIDTTEPNSVLEIIIFGSEIPNRPEMLQVEPLRSLLEDKWDRFASKLFLMNFLIYVAYLIIFTSVSFYRKEGKPPFPIENVPLDHLRCLGELISVLGAVWFFYKAIKIFKGHPPKFKALYMDGFSDILLEYVGVLVISLALAWINVLYYSRGSKQMGMYNVMMQRMILGDILQFLCFYAVFLFGFSAAVVALIADSPPSLGKLPNGTLAPDKLLDVEPVQCKDSYSYDDIRFTTLEMFKFTIGMGDLQFTDHVQYVQVFYILLILYIVLTYILLLNMLIALMGNTVQKISEESENIWKLQRAFTILDMERTLPTCLMNKLFPGGSKLVCFRNNQDESRTFFRVEEMNWRQWRSDLGVVYEEDPGHGMTMPGHAHGKRWNLSPLLHRIRRRHHHLQQPDVP